MLFNPEKLRGIAPKIQKLAARERTISLAVQGDASEKPLPAGLGGAGSPGPVQLADMNGGGGRKAGAAESAAASADTTPLRRMVSTPLEAGEAPRVEIVPGVLDSGVRFCSLFRSVLRLQLIFDKESDKGSVSCSGSLSRLCFKATIAQACTQSSTSCLA